MPAERQPASDGRVVVNLGGAHPELLVDLAAVPKRARAARLRHLAALGLAALRGGGVAVGVGPGPTVPLAPVDAGRRERILGRLGLNNE